jgi:hypothetical protein
VEERERISIETQIIEYLICFVLLQLLAEEGSLLFLIG